MKKLSKHDVRERLIQGLQRGDLSRAQLEAARKKPELKAKIGEVLGYGHTSDFQLGKKTVERALAEATVALRGGLGFDPSGPPSPGVAELPGLPGEDYDARLRHLVSELEQGRAGQVLDFGEGRAFRVDALIGHGNTTLVLSVSPANGDTTFPSPAALRIPLSSGEFGPRGLTHAYAEILDAYREGLEAGLGAAGVAPQLFDAVEGQFALVEQLDLRFTLKDLLLQRVDAKDLPATSDAELKSFARALAPFSGIGDFDPRNVAWDAKSQAFKLFDFAEVHLYRGAISPVAFERPAFEDTRDLDWRALQQLIRQNKVDPSSIFATPETRALMRTEPEVSDAQLDHADQVIRQLNRYVYEARLELLSEPDEHGVMRGVNPICGETFEVVGDQAGAAEQLAKDRAALLAD